VTGRNIGQGEAVVACERDANVTGGLGGGNCEIRLVGDRGSGYADGNAILTIPYVFAERSQNDGLRVFGDEEAAGVDFGESLRDGGFYPVIQVDTSVEPTEENDGGVLFYHQ
jgi:hypothetical protein